jgi:predicted dehydrogenase
MRPALDPLDVALVGCGRWGRRLLAALQAHPQLRVRAVADADAEARAAAQRIAPGADVVASLADALPRATALFVATPSGQHASHALAALDAGLDVFVEKPLALSGWDAARLCERVEQCRRIGMVGHVLRFDLRVERFVSALRTGRVGQLREVRTRRLTQSGSPAPLWTLAPHDVATLLALDGGHVDDVEARPNDGEATPKAGTQITLAFESGLTAAVEVDTRADRPCRQTRARGTDGLLVLDELRGDPSGDPLRSELDHFVDCVATRQAPRTSFFEGLAVVDVLERAEEALRARGPRVASQ